MKSILTIGGAVYDIYIKPAHPIQGIHDNQACIMLPEGKKNEVSETSYFSGGGSTNCAVAFKRLGFEVTSFFKVGSDDAGYFVINDVNDEKVNTEHVLITEQAHTGTSYIIQSPSGNHPILVDRAANLTLEEQELPLGIIQNFDYLYVSSLSGRTAAFLPKIAQAAHQAGVALATNPGSSQIHGNIHALKESLPHIDILILNSYEASILFETLHAENPSLQKASCPAAVELCKKWLTLNGISYTIADYFKKIVSSGVRIAVVTNGSEGVYVATTEGMFFHPSIKTELVNSVGAGDAFAACFVAMIAQQKPLEDAIRAGIINSASVLNYLGAKTGLLNKEELQERLAAFDKSLLKRID